MKKLLFLTLNTFSVTGGIEKVCRAAGKALYELVQEEKDEFTIFSMSDKSKDVSEEYFPASVYKSFGGRKLSFVLESIRKGRTADVIIISHINLLPVCYVIKKLSPKTKIILMAHGIEVWQPLSAVRMKMLGRVDLFLAVSEFTKQKLHKVLGVPWKKLQVLNNCLDPFLKKKSTPAKEKEFATKYGIEKNDLVLMTLTRIKFSEQYKGYDKVIQVLPVLKQSHPNIKYLIIGRYDEEEKNRLDKMIVETGMKDTVIFAGFIEEEDVATHFNLASIYIMPSSREGFGIVFIEALFYGKPVIAGNKDGSVDALANGEFGMLVNPDNAYEIINAVTLIADNPETYLPLEKKLAEKFGFAQYKKNWYKILYSNAELFDKSSIKNFNYVSHF